MLSHFSLTAIDSQEILHLVLGLVGTHLAAVSTWMVTVFLFIIQSMSFRYPDVSNLFHSVTIC